MGVSLVRDIVNKENLLWRFVKKENYNTYEGMYDELKGANFDIIGIVVDGKSPFFAGFDEVPVQMCHFHMAKILRKYLTKSPNREFNKDLWKLWYGVGKLDAVFLREQLFWWFHKHGQALTDGYVDSETEKWVYSRERTLKAYKSLRRFSPWLFTYRTSKWIPNTNNSIEDTFGQMKKKIKIHNGLRWDRNAKIIHHYLSRK